MRKIYIAPETEITKTLVESLLVTPSQTEVEGPGGDNGQGGGGPGVDTPTTPTDPDTPPFARQHNNWMWDTMEDEF
jgi:hypothetical protein